MGVRLSLLLFFWHGFHGLRGFVLGEGRGQMTEAGLGFWGENIKRISNVEQGMSNDEVGMGWVPEGRGQSKSSTLKGESGEKGEGVTLSR